MHSLWCSKWIDLISWKLTMIVDTLNNKALSHLWSITSTCDLLITNSHSQRIYLIIIKHLPFLLIQLIRTFWTGYSHWLLTKIHSTIFLDLISAKNFIFLIFIPILFIRNWLRNLLVHCIRSMNLSIEVFLFFYYAIFANIRLFR
jgi:hypothetical protein